MEMYSGYQRLAGAARIILFASGAIFFSAPVSAGPLEDLAIVVCTDALSSDYGAIELSEVYHKRSSGRRSVYATARLPGGESPRFRCAVREEATLGKVEVFADGSLSITKEKAGWISAEPYRVTPEPEAEAEDPADAPVPDPDVATPEPEPSEEAGPSFSKPGSGSGSRFKRPKT